jgi:hypothetical protein
MGRMILRSATRLVVTVGTVTSLLFAGACASGGASRGARESFGGRDLLTRSELARVEYLENAHAAVVQLRPRFLQPRPGASSARREPPTIVVYLDGLPAGGPEALRALSVAHVESIRLVQPTESYSILGAGRGVDAVMNVTRRRRGPGRH